MQLSGIITILFGIYMLFIAWAFSVQTLWYAFIFKFIPIILALWLFFLGIGMLGTISFTPSTPEALIEIAE